MHRKGLYRMNKKERSNGEDSRRVVYPNAGPIPGLIPGSDQYEEMRIPSEADESTSWVVHLADGGSETVPGSFTFRVSSGCIIFHQWGEELEEGRRERKARFIFPMVRVKFITKVDR